MARKPQLNLTKGNTYTVTLEYDEPKSGSNQGRNWYLYSVDYQGQKVVFFANDTQHKMLQNTGAKTGDTIVIGIDENGKWHVNDDTAKAMKEAGEVFGDSEPAAPIAMSRGVPKKSFEGLIEDYRACLGAAHVLCVEEFKEFTNEDVRSIATSLYIQGTREGVAFPKD